MHSERLRVLTKTFCKIEALVDNDRNVLIDQHGDPEIKVLNLRVELPYTYLVAWYVMHCPSLMAVVHTSEDCVIFSEVRALDLTTCLYILY